jgi:RHS repeat-associated protein
VTHFTPGWASISGAAWATTAVTVNGGTTDRKGEFFHREVSIPNGDKPVWFPVVIQPRRPPSGTATNVLMSLATESYTYDLDGNLTFDGLWNYEWDAKNRLKTMAMTNISGIPDSERKKLNFAYDYMGRRISKTVSEWDGDENFIEQSTVRFLYDGWNLVAILNSQSSLLQSFLWGQDLSGTMDEAGGVGGLLMMTQHTPAVSRHFAAYDGNGNVAALINAGNSSVSARYEYSPFGETQRATGALARDNPIRFSSKFTDEESGLVYYGYRYYSPELGRWINRDPIEEVGGLNFYAFVANNSINRFDPFGLYDDWELDMRLAIAAEGSAFFATYAYSADLLEWHNHIMEEGWIQLQEAGKEIALAAGMFVGGGIAGRIVGKGLTKVAKPVLDSLAGRSVTQALGPRGKTVLGQYRPTSLDSHEREET